MKDGETEGKDGSRDAADGDGLGDGNKQQ
jgi:hypothetical protein